MHTEELAAYWARTERSRSQVTARLREAGFSGLDLPSFFHDIERVARPLITAETEEQALKRLAGAMNDPKSPEYNGLFLLDVSRALRDEAHLAGALRAAVDGMPYRQMAAFKANHSLPLQFARLLQDPDAGLEVASAAEAVAACSLGFKPENIIFANPTINARELLVCSLLDITAFCFDHVDKLNHLLSVARERGVDRSKLRLIVRLAAPYGDASVTMRRFGIDALKNERMVGDIVRALGSSGARLGGASFHVGLGVRSHAAYEHAFESVRRLFERCRAELGYLPRVVCVGGGIAPTDTGHRHFGAISVTEQIATIGRGARGLRRALGQPFEVWSEIGQGYVGSAGSVLARVDFHEARENPARSLLVCPLTAPGEVLWAQPGKPVFAEHEQRLLTHLSSWSLGVARYTTVYPEIWALTEQGAIEKVEYDEAKLVPTMIFGKTCDAADALNPRRGGESIRLLMPNLAAYPARAFWLRVRSAAYMDTGGDFNWQTTKFFPTHHVVSAELEETCPAPPGLIRGTGASAGDLVEHRDRILSRSLLTSAQIHEVKRLVAEQFIEREQMISWLRRRGQLNSPRDLDMLRYLFWELVSDCVDSGLSVVRLKVRRDAPDSDGQVVAAVCVKVLGSEDRPTLPLRLTRDVERHRLLPVLGLEATALRRIYRVNDALREKIFPMAYVAMSAAQPGEGAPVRALRSRVIELARGADDIKSVGALSTGERSSDVWESIEGCIRLLTIPYDEVTFQGERPFGGIRFGDAPGELRFFLRDLRGPHRFADPLPVGLRLSADLHDEAHLLSGSIPVFDEPARR